MHGNATCLTDTLVFYWDLLLLHHSWKDLVYWALYSVCFQSLLQAVYSSCVYLNSVSLIYSYHNKSCVRQYFSKNINFSCKTCRGLWEKYELSFDTKISKGFFFFFFSGEGIKKIREAPLKYKDIVDFFTHVTSLKVLGHSILFNTPIMMGFLKEAVIVKTPFSYKEKILKWIKNIFLLTQIESCCISLFRTF